MLALAQDANWGGLAESREDVLAENSSNPCELFQVRLVIAEKALKCEEHDVSLPLSEHNEPWFMRLNSTGEVPVLIHGENIICEATQIIDYLEQTFLDGNVKALCDFLALFSTYALPHLPSPLFLPLPLFYGGGLVT